ncbi:MAG: tetraacyldisaccharide 4'-kinase [Flavobacteriaceae bacterium]|nr:tetraacyldisaccharide 4'-kinase [Flavobacteriaceae bacterium]
MNFRKLLFPFSVLYDGVTSLRNLAYDKGWLESKRYEIPVICVGNLSVGGTGKSPMVAYLVEFLRKDFKVAVLSRGYKRKTRGFREVEVTSTVEEVGDEPLQFKQNFPKITVAVCEDRQEGIERLKEQAGLVILDDAFQHRKVDASLTILLTPFHDLFIDDLLLPAGNLRESRKGAKRADIIIVTKCPEDASYARLNEIQYELNLLPHQQVFFSRISYDQLIYGETETLPLEYLSDKPFTLVTGIANPQPLLDHLQRKGYEFQYKRFGDHHAFSESEIHALRQHEIILTTEKDYMRLQPKLGKFALYYLPIKTEILNGKDPALKRNILYGIKKG